jgi:ubiquitin carboxyl-terminal hydrolase 14
VGESRSKNQIGSRAGTVAPTNAHSPAAVPPERQKLMSKAWKGVLKDDVDFSTLSLADGLIISLMGSADTAAKAAADKLVFVEDMSAAEIVKAGHRIPSGLENTGNTCYANSE